MKQLGKRKPRSQTEAIEQLPAPTIAFWIDQGLIVHTPFQFTAAGWRRLNAARRAKKEPGEPGSKSVSG